jgi:hypothetical protein
VIQCKNLSGINIIPDFNYSLKELIIVESNKITSKMIEESLPRFVNLKKFVLKNCSNIQSLEIVKNDQLESLNFRNCQRLKKLNIKSKCLHSLNLCGTSLNDWEIENTLSVISHQLIYLELRNCKELSFFNMEMLKGCKNLQTLNLSRTQVTDEFVESSILEFCPSLVLLDLSWCKKLKFVQIKNLKMLKLLYFDFSENLEKFSVDTKIEKLNLFKTKIKKEEISFNGELEI